MNRRSQMRRQYFRGRHRVREFLRGKVAPVVGAALVGAGLVPARQSNPRAVQEERHPGWGVTPERIASAYLQAEGGEPQMMYDLFDDLAERDLTLGGLADGRAEALAGKPRVIQAASNAPEDIEAAREFRRVWEALPHRRMVRHQVYAFNFYGFGATEIGWAHNPATKMIEPVALWNVRNRQFSISRIGNLGIDLKADIAPDQPLIRTSLHDSRGEPLIDGKWIITRRVDNLPLARAGLMRGSAWLSAFKMNVVGDWLVYIKRFGLPFVLARISDWTSAQERRRAEQVLQRIGDDGAAIVPKSNKLELEFKDAVRVAGTTSSELHSVFAQMADMQNAKRWNGASLASESGDGASSFALAKEHGGIRFELILSDDMQIAESLERQLVVPWMRQNGINARPPKIRAHLVRVADPKQMAEIAKILVKELKIEIAEDQLLEHIGIRGAEGA